MQSGAVGDLLISASLSSDPLLLLHPFVFSPTIWIGYHFRLDLSLFHLHFFKSFCVRAEQSHLIYNLRSNFNVNYIFLVGIKCKLFLLIQFKYIYFCSLLEATDRANCSGPGG